MKELSEVLRDQAGRGERAYAALDVPAESASRFVDGVRATRRRQRAGALAMSIVAIAAVSAGVVSLTTRQDEPAVVPPSPGTVVWSVDVGSESWSSPALLGGDLVVTAADDGVIRGFDVETGDALWEVNTGDSVRGAVAVAGGMAFASSQDGLVYAIAPDGELVWSTEVSPANPVRAPWQPMSAAPLPVGDAVCLGDHVGTVTCLNRLDGTVLWTAQIGGRVSAQAASDGETLFVGADDAHMYALDLDSGVQVWAVNVGGEVASAPAVADGVVVAGNRGTEVVGIDALTGERLWTVSMGTSWAESAPVVVDGIAYFGSSAAGQVVGADISDGSVVWRAEVGGMPWARPSAAGDMVYASSVRTGNQLPWDGAVYAIDKETGKILWSVPVNPALRWQPEGPGYGVGTEPLVTEDLVIFTALDGVVYAIAR
jgi:outer membrane protein assembly factor BamB